MTVIFTETWETGDFALWDNHTAGCTVVASPVHHGNYALQATGSDQQIALKLGFNAASTYTRLYFRMATLPSSGNFAKIAMMYGSVGGEVGIGIYNDGGTMKWGLMKPSGSTYVAATINVDTWYCLEFQRTTGTGANGVATIWVDGLQVATSATETYTDNCDMLTVGIDFTTQAVTTFIDCIVVSDAYNGPEVAGAQVACRRMLVGVGL